MKTITLNNGVEMPLQGFGVFQIAPQDCETAVRNALDVGYRMIDTAQAYYNEESVGRTWRASGIPREELFLVTKVWISNAGNERAIGLSNFYDARFVDLAENMDVKPAVVQLEANVFTQQKRMRELMASYGTRLMAWAPLAEGQHGIFTNSTLTQIGAKYGKTAAQTALRFLMAENIIAIPKSVHRERLIRKSDIG